MKKLLIYVILTGMVILSFSGCTSTNKENINEVNANQNATAASVSDEESSSTLDMVKAGMGDLIEGVEIYEVNPDPNTKILQVWMSMSADDKDYDSEMDRSTKIGAKISELSLNEWFDYDYIYAEIWIKGYGLTNTLVWDGSPSGPVQYAWDYDNKAVTASASESVPTEDSSMNGIWDKVEDTAEEELEATESTDYNISTGQKNALDKAKSYLSFSAFSYQGLIEQLEYEQFSHEDAVYAVDNCGADWNEQAAKKAASYLDISPFSRDGLIEQLEYEGFTHEQSVYGVEANGY